MPIPTSAASSATSAASTAAKGANTADIIGAGGQAAALAISTIANISDANKRRKFELNFSLLNADAQRGLNQKLMEAQSESERLTILSQFLTQLNSQRITNLASYYSDKEKQKRTTTLVIVGGIALVAIAIVYFAAKK
jgi:hypothetical protein